MIQWNKVTQFSQAAAIVLGVAVFFLGFYVGGTKNILNEPGKSNEEKLPDAGYTIPTLNFPLSYFGENTIMWGSVGTSSDSDNSNTWDMAAVDVGYQSFPTTTITLSQDSYSNEIENLPPLKSRAAILRDTGLPLDSFVSNLNEYPDLARRFLPDYEITDTKYFDVDGDGKKESVISLCGGGNHCPDKVIIVKEANIIFSTSAGAIGPKIVDTGSSNGFYVQWAPWSHDGSKWDVGLCCTPGYVKTRFVFNDGKFIPIYEQEVLFIEVKNSNN